MTGGIYKKGRFVLYIYAQAKKIKNQQTRSRISLKGMLYICAMCLFVSYFIMSNKN